MKVDAEIFYMKANDICYWLIFLIIVKRKMAWPIQQENMYDKKNRGGLKNVQPFEVRNKEQT